VIWGVQKVDMLKENFHRLWPYKNKHNKQNYVTKKDNGKKKTD